MSSLPSTMRAWVYRKSGPVDQVLHLEDDYPMPQLKDYPIVIKVHSVGLNPVGYKIISEIPFFLTKKPGVPEQDFSGTIAGGNLEGSGFKIGDEVYGALPADKGQMPAGVGALAEYTVARSSLLARKPENLSFAQAAGITLTAITAHITLIKRGKAKSGDRVLINGGTSGVGVFAIQMAKATGCHVVVTCSSSSFDIVKGFGADEVIDYKNGNLTEKLTQEFGSADKRFDIVFDTIGVPALYSYCGGYIKNTGRYLNISMPTSTMRDAISSGLHVLYAKMCPTFLGGPPVQLQLIMSNLEKEADSLKDIAHWVEEGNLKPLIDSEHSFEDALKASQKIRSHRAKGKVIVNVSQ